MQIGSLYAFPFPDHKLNAFENVACAEISLGGQQRLTPTCDVTDDVRVTLPRDVVGNFTSWKFRFAQKPKVTCQLHRFA